MEFSVKSGSPEKQRSSCIVVGIYETRRLSPHAELLDQVSEGYISNILRKGDLDGKLGQSLLLHHVPHILAERVLLVGCGKEREFTSTQYKKALETSYQVLSSTGASEAVSFLPELHVKGKDIYWKIRRAVEITHHAMYSFDQFKSEAKASKRSLKRLIFSVASRRDLAAGEQAVAHGTAIAEGVEFCRDLANMPPNICNPVYLSEQADALAETYPQLTVTKVKEDEMKALGMNAYLAVSSGSANEAVMTLMSYKGADDDQQPIVLVGKGLTFDTGGISIKPSANMDEMKYDMGGAASVLGTMKALAQLQLPINVIGVVAGCENMPDGLSYRPGDILTSMSGQTIEVLNTDAEGRLVLCDALTYVERFEPQAVVDIATLTGACVIALGDVHSGLLSNHNSLAHELLGAAEQSGDKAWQLPLDEEYQQQLDSPFADMQNIGGREAGTITAACFLSRFTKKYHWAHLDIAGTAWNGGAKRNATGRPVSLLSQFLLQRAKVNG